VLGGPVPRSGLGVHVGGAEAWRSDGVNRSPCAAGRQVSGRLRLVELRDQLTGGGDHDRVEGNNEDGHDRGEGPAALSIQSPTAKDTEPTARSRSGYVPPAQAGQWLRPPEGRELICPRRVRIAADPLEEYVARYVIEM
jgi:hypothetical protein